MKNFKHVFGGALLVTSTSIGAGMMALPITTGTGGFIPSVIVFVLSWMIMCLTGLFFAEICISMPKDTNIISMSSKYLGPLGQVLTWIIYLFLFYTLSVAYISAGGTFFQNILKDFLSETLCIGLFVIIFGYIVFKGTKIVDRANLFLTSGLFISFFFFIIASINKSSFNNLKHFHFLNSFVSFPIVLLSFGYQGIVPTLTNYLDKDPKKIKTAIIVGTLITLLIYLIWEFLILSIIPLGGEFGLLATKAKGLTAISPLKNYTNANSILLASKFFAFFAITTSFLGVNLGLFDFLADGLKLQKKGIKKIFLAILTFAPSLLITISYPKIFLIALDYAGSIGGNLLLIFLPTLLVWLHRYVKKDNFVKPIVFGGRSLLSIVFIFIVLEILTKFIDLF